MNVYRSAAGLEEAAGHDGRDVEVAAISNDAATPAVGALDCCVHHCWGTQHELMGYMSAAWREYLGRMGSLPDGAGAIPVVTMPRLLNPEGDKLADAGGPEGEPAGASPEVLVDQVLDRHGLGGAVLCHDVAGMTPLLLNHRLGAEIARAANDWTIDRWLSRDPRLGAAILVPNQLADVAADEIRRVGRHPQMVGVLMMANGLGKPFGHPGYRAIMRAAAESDLPVILHSGGENSMDSAVPSTSQGTVDTYSAYHALLDQAPVTHLTSLIAQGVFDELPSLRVVVAGAGVSWFAPHMFRFDNEYREFRREAPWLKRYPSEYLRDHVRVTTYPLERVSDARAWQRYLEAMPELEDVLVYASGYPNWDASTPQDVSDVIPERWRRKVLYDNAYRFFRWPKPVGGAISHPSEVQ